MSDDEKPLRTINDAYWKEWVACQATCLKYAYRFRRNGDDAVELRDAAFEAMVDGSRPLRDGTKMEDHIKGCIKSIASNESTSQSELVLRKKKADRDPNPAAETRSPDEHAMDNERTALLVDVLRVLTEKSERGSIEHGYLVQRGRGVEDLDAIAKALGVTYRQVVDAQKGVRRKAEELLRERGYALDDEDDDGDDDGEES